MPYFHNKDVNLLLIHIPKTGGTSLENYFSQKFNVPLNNNSLFNPIKQNEIRGVKINSTLQHMTLNFIIKNSNVFNINRLDLTIISIVRNPYHRIMSDLFFLGLVNPNFSKNKITEAIKNYLNNDYDGHKRPQYLYLVDDNTNLYSNVKILQTEQLNEDMKNIGYTDFDLNRNTNSHKLNYIDYLNNESITIINNYYAKDFELFNYTKFKTVPIVQPPAPAVPPQPQRQRRLGQRQVHFKIANPVANKNTESSQPRNKLLGVWM
jgi:hypothetical protein